MAPHRDSPFPIRVVSCPRILRTRHAVIEKPDAGSPSYSIVHTQSSTIGRLAGVHAHAKPCRAPTTLGQTDDGAKGNTEAALKTSPFPEHLGESDTVHDAAQRSAKVLLASLV